MMIDPPALVEYWMARSVSSVRMISLGQKLYGGAMQAGIMVNPGPNSTRPQRNFSTALTTGALWTQNRLMSCGYIVDPTCNRCRTDDDDQRHRIWVCPAEQNVRIEYAQQEANLRTLEQYGDVNTAMWADIAA